VVYVSKGAIIKAGMKQYEPTTRGPHKGEVRFRVSWRDSAGKQFVITKYGRRNAKGFKKDIEDGFVNRDTGEYFDEEQKETQRQVLDGMINTRNERTFGYLASRFIRIKKEEGDVSPATVEDYRQLLDIHVRPTLGDLMLDEIGLSQIEDMVMAIKSNDRKRNAGPRTINKCLVLTRSIFKYGIDLQWCTENPATRKRLIKYQKRDGKVMQSAETWRIINNTDKPYDIAMKILAFTGCRRGEAVALKWSDIDFEGRTLLIERSFKARRFGIQPAKTKQRRRVPLPEEVLISLRTLAAESGVVDPGDWLFPDETGEYPIGGDVLLRRFKWAEKRSSLSGFVIHDMRQGTVLNEFTGLSAMRPFPGCLLSFVGSVVLTTAVAAQLAAHC
jgi:integrase